MESQALQRRSLQTGHSHSLGRPVFGPQKPHSVTGPDLGVGLLGRGDPTGEGLPGRGELAGIGLAVRGEPNGPGLTARFGDTGRGTGWAGVGEGVAGCGAAVTGAAVVCVLVGTGDGLFFSREGDWVRSKF